MLTSCTQDKMVFTATAHSRPLILLLRGSTLAPSAALTNCVTRTPLGRITSPPLALPTADVVYEHTNGDIYVYMRTDKGKRLCVAGLKTPTF